jgi:polyisoprenoid-binding protein YceI
MVLPMRLASLLLVCAALAPAQRAVYPLRPGPRNVFAVEVDKTGVLRGRTHVFIVQRYSGRVEYDAAHPAQSLVDIEADSAGITVTDSWLSRGEWKRVEEYTLSPRVLDVLPHPKITFRSTSVEPAGGKRFRIRGPLSIRGRALPGVFEAAVALGAGGALLAEGSTRFPMTRYGIEPFTEFLGLIGTRDEIRVRFQFHLLPVKP